MAEAVNIAIFASGSGTNAQRIMEFFKDRNDVSVKVLMSNNPNAYALERAKNFDVDTFVFDRDSFFRSELVVDELKKLDIDWVILAGFLWLIPQNLIKNFPCRIINIHPALLPNYGGKGMYGMNVHNAVINAGEKESGISIHYINEVYDEGEIIFQAKCLIEEGDTAEILAQKIHELEYRHFPEIIDSVIKIK